ncbi:hypothetical protein BCR35DRAFT_307402 [Leucosporidium creatinivorum]|uniref:Uncharacterized protein n=1 Tax=Leucosporidium creatinivorum TaxID=106004 RepID=A0A1Y2EMW9_9BASI|nr:hypothetical protein BCR35DRAFT_307402 [Leucosporidium creatinivorum]
MTSPPSHTHPLLAGHAPSVKIAGQRRASTGASSSKSPPKVNAYVFPLLWYRRSAREGAGSERADPHFGFASHLSLVSSRLAPRSFAAWSPTRSTLSTYIYIFHIIDPSQPPPLPTPPTRTPTANTHTVNPKRRTTPRRGSKPLLPPNIRMRERREREREGRGTRGLLSLV